MLRCYPVLILCSSVFICALSAQAQTSRAADSARSVAFDRLDRTSRTLLSTVYCARASARGRASGVLGPPDSLGRRGQCLRIGDTAFGVFFTPDSAFTKASLLRVLDIQNQTRYLEPVDTSRILAEARAMSDAVRKGFPTFQQAQRQFAPLSIRSDGDSIEVWLLPARTLMASAPISVGGERGYIYSPDGRTLVREIDASDRFREVPIPDSGQVSIISKEDDLPLLSELIVANELHGEGRQVQIVTAAYASLLTGSEPNSVWIQIHKR